MMYSGRFGFEFAGSDRQSHNFELELALTSDSESVVVDEPGDPFTVNVDMRIVPIMANYRFIAPLGRTVQFFAGAGLGLGRINLDAEAEGYRVSDHDDAFSWQAFSGVSVGLSRHVSLSLGARYLKIEEATLFDFDTDVGDDVEILAGLRFSF